MRKLIAILLVVLTLAALCTCVFADVISPTATTAHATGSSESGGPQTGFVSTPIVIAFAVLVVCAVASIFVIKPMVKKEH